MVTAHKTSWIQQKSSHKLPPQHGSSTLPPHKLPAVCKAQNQKGLSIAGLPPASPHRPPPTCLVDAPPPPSFSSALPSSSNPPPLARSPLWRRHRRGAAPPSRSSRPVPRSLLKLLWSEMWLVLLTAATPKTRNPNNDTAPSSPAVNHHLARPTHPPHFTAIFESCLEGGE
jgi:hypothetical protein